MQLDRDNGQPGHVLRAGQQGGHPLHAQLAHAAAVHMDRGQRGLEQGADGGIVETDDSQIVRKGKAQPAGGFHHTRSEYVVKGEHGGGAAGPVEQLERGACCAFNITVTHGDVAFFDGKSKPFHCSDKGVVALAGDIGGKATGEHIDFVVAAQDQMLKRLPDAVALVRDDAGQVETRRDMVCQHNP